MTYVKQLEQYEEAVMRKRLEEMTDNELDSLLKEVEDDKSKGVKRPPPTQTPE
jgi:5'-deoxynucleotidase YfbR-like HD superfamily hydrolase